jgi:hypothetical protein
MPTTTNDIPAELRKIADVQVAPIARHYAGDQKATAAALRALADLFHEWQQNAVCHGGGCDDLADIFTKHEPLIAAALGLDPTA